MSINKPQRDVLRHYGYRKLRRVTDEATGTVIDTLRVPLHDGTNRDVDLPPSAQTPGKLVARLRDMDACLPPVEERKELLSAILEAVPKKRLRYAARTGWNEDRSAFVMLHVVIPNQANGVIGLSPQKQEPGQKLATIGTLAGWRSTVAAPAELSSALTFCISVAFAAPLLTFVGELPFGVSLFGTTRIGKSRGILAAGSVIGIGAQDQLPSWDLSDPGFQRLLARFQNGLSPRRCHEHRRERNSAAQAIGETVL